MTTYSFLLLMCKKFWHKTELVSATSKFKYFEGQILFSDMLF